MRVGIDATAVPGSRPGRGTTSSTSFAPSAKSTARTSTSSSARARTNRTFCRTAGPQRSVHSPGLPRSRRSTRLGAGRPPPTSASPPARRAPLPHYTMPLRHAARSVVTFCDMTFVLYPDLHQRSNDLLSAMMRRSARRADRLIAISKSTRDDFVRMWGSTKGGSPRSRRPQTPSSTRGPRRKSPRPVADTDFDRRLHPVRRHARAPQERGPAVEAFGTVANQLSDSIW